MDVRKTLEAMGMTLPPPSPCNGRFVKVKYFGDHLLYVSGSGSETPFRDTYGKLGKDVSLQEGRAAAADTILNILTAIEEELGNLDRITSFVKLLVFVSSDPNFYDQPLVADGATELLVQIFGKEIGCPARSAIGVAVLPGNISVETECIVAFE